ncbi:MAG TPA: iron ABC transporter permease [Acidobacteriota bacterium]|nr:iron ABC transporter permease [Acidobacteriota bacterium]
MNAAAKAKPWETFFQPTRTLVLGFAAACFVFFCLLPAGYMLVQSFAGPAGSLSLNNYRQLLAEPRHYTLLANSLLLAAGSAALAALIGIPLGFMLARVDVPAKRIARIVLLTPLVIPPYVLALAWIYVGGSAGFGSAFVRRDLLSRWTYSIAGAVIVLGLSYFPIVMLAAEFAARNVAAHLEEAALLIAKPGAVFRRITAPLIAPGIVAATLLVFVLAMAEFGVPGLLRVPVFTTEVFTAFAALYDFGRATALAVPLLMTILAAGFAVTLLLGDRAITSPRAVRTGLQLNHKGWKGATVAVVGVVILLSVALPIAVLVRESFGAWGSAATVGDSGRAVCNSLLISTCGATLIVMIGAILGYCVARMSKKARISAELVSLVSFAVPGTVVAIGLIGLWNRPGLPGDLYKSMVIIVIACVARFLPLATLILAAGVRQIPPSTEEAAEVAGAGWFRIFVRIIVPQLRGGLAAAWVIAFIFSIGELGATILVAPPGESTLPVRIYTLLANTTSNQVAALALIQAAIVLAPLILLAIFVNRKGEAV